MRVDPSPTFAARWETEHTALKDCDSSLGVWNDPPTLNAVDRRNSVKIGAGSVHLLDDVSIAALTQRFAKWRGKRLGLLAETWTESDFTTRLANLLPRYLFQAGVLCRRLYPSAVSGFEDENRAFFWPVSTGNFDVILWIESSDAPVSARCRATGTWFPLRRFVQQGGALLLGGEARRFLPYLLDHQSASQAWPGVQNVKLYGDLRSHLSSAALRIDLQADRAETLAPIAWHVHHAEHGYLTRCTYGNGLSLESRVCFAATDRVVLEWSLTNRADSPRPARLQLSGDFSGAENLTPAKVAGNGLMLNCSTRGNPPVFLRIDAADPPIFRWRAKARTYRAQSKAMSVAAETRIEGCVAISLTIGSKTIRPRTANAGSSFWEQARERSKQRFEVVSASAPADELGRALLRRAVTTLAHNTWHAPPTLAGNKFGSRRIVEVQRSYYPLWAPYEAGFYAIGVRNFDVDLARDQIAVLSSLQHPDGWIPLVVGNRFEMDLEHTSQMPTLALAAWQVHQQQPDRAFLKTVYPHLRRNIEWWYRHRQPRGDGVFGYKHAQEGAGDDHPRADLPTGEMRSGMRRFLSPDACGFVLMELHCLTRITEAIGRRDEAKRWRTRAAELARRTIEACYSRTDEMLWDVSLETDVFERRLSPWHFVPLWAGIGLGPKRAASMIRRHLLGKFLSGPVPFPIVDPADPAYLSDTYWRGPSWPQVWGILLQTLWWYGFEREADEAADRLIRLCADWPYLMEIYDTRTGQGLSLPEYSFTAAAVIEILLRRYRDPPPWEANTRLAAYV